MKTLLSILLLILALNTTAGGVVRVEFTPCSVDDIDIFFRKGFEVAGYESFVNYLGRSDDRPYDLLFRYEYDGYDLTGSLYDHDGLLLRHLKQKVLYSGRLEKQAYQFLENLLDIDIDVKDKRGRIRFDYDIISSEIVKLDSAVYVLTVCGSENVSAEKVRQEFLHVAGFLTKEFRTFFEGSYYLYERGESWQPSSQLIGWKISGIVMGDNMAGLGFIIHPLPPDIYLDYQDHLVEGLAAPWDSEEAGGQSLIYVLRNSSKSADNGPNLVFLDGKAVCGLNYGRYTAIPVSPGPHVIAVKHPDFNPKKMIEELALDIKPYNHAFVSVIWGYHVGIICQEVKKYEAVRLIQGLEKEECR